MDCELCGEEIKTDEYGFPVNQAGEEVSEFIDPNNPTRTVLGHFQCAMDAGLRMA
ncbi:hypothetical protein [Actinomadura miaoliensis]|uniref:Uncharacterized protein n=1 Tax=Actinomadura miaoliensis TaxID=430685 RepID=A0ABP7W7D8_9ACTN